MRRIIDCHSSIFHDYVYAIVECMFHSNEGETAAFKCTRRDAERKKKRDGHATH